MIKIFFELVVAVVFSVVVYFLVTSLFSIVFDGPFENIEVEIQYYAKVKPALDYPETKALLVQFLSDNKLTNEEYNQIALKYNLLVRAELLGGK